MGSVLYPRLRTSTPFTIWIGVISIMCLLNPQNSYPRQHHTQHFITNMMKSNQFCKNVIFQEFHLLQHPVHYRVNKEMKQLQFVTGRKESLFLLMLSELIKSMICKLMSLKFWLCNN